MPSVSFGVVGTRLTLIGSSRIRSGIKSRRNGGTASRPAPTKRFRCLEVRDQVPAHLGLGRQVPIQPDLVFRNRGTDVYVGDIKYKLTADARARTNDYYQLLAYTTALDLPEGILIYCREDGGRPECEVTVRHAGKRLHTLAIDFRGSPDDVNTAINEAADRIVDRANRYVSANLPASAEKPA